MNFEALKDIVDYLGDSIHKSGIFGCANAYQGRVFATEALCGNLLRIASQWHVFPNGRLTRRADSMLAGFVEAGGTYQIMQRDENAVGIAMQFGDSHFEFGLTWDECLLEPFVYQGKESEIIAMLHKGQQPPLKPKYATPHSRMQMMWARLISDAVRAICPTVVVGRYTGEELGRDEALSLKEILGKQPATTVEKVAPTVPPAAEVVSEQTVQSDENTANVTVTETPPAVETNIDVEHLRMQAILEVAGYLDAMKAPQTAIDVALKRRGVSSLNELSLEQAQAWRVQLAEKVNAEPAKTTGSANDPVDELQTKRIKSLLDQLAQSGAMDICERVRNKLKGSGLKLADLSYGEAEKLIGCLETKNMEVFFGLTLLGGVAKK